MMALRVSASVPQVHWHGKSPVFALDMHGDLLASGGAEPEGCGGVKVLHPDLQ
jgi:hypothetical protein